MKKNKTIVRCGACKKISSLENWEEATIKNSEFVGGCPVCKGEFYDIIPLEVGCKVELLKDIEFDYGIAARQGEHDSIYKIDDEGYWLKKKEIYIVHGSEREYLKVI